MREPTDSELAKMLLWLYAGVIGVLLLLLVLKYVF